MAKLREYCISVHDNHSEVLIGRAVVETRIHALLTTAAGAMAHAKGVTDRLAHVAANDLYEAVERVLMTANVDAEPQAQVVVQSF